MNQLLPVTGLKAVTSIILTTSTNDNFYQALPTDLPPLLSGAGTRPNPFDSIRSLLAGVIHQDAALQPATARLIQKEEAALKVVPYALTSQQANILALHGIPNPQTASDSHSHPINNIFERHILLTLLPAHLRQPYCVIDTKDRKVRDFLSPRLIRQHVNLPITLKDLGRYDASAPNAWMPARFDARTLFIHDVMQFQTPMDIAKLMHRHPEVDTIYATAILPSEALNREPSLFPDVYTLLYLENSFHYIMEDTSCESYEQPYEPLQWLVSNQVGPFKITLLEQLCAHKLFAITRLDVLPTEQTRLMPVPDAVVLPNALNTNLSQRDRTVSRDLLDATLEHAEHLKRYRKTDAAAKVRSFKKPHHDWITKPALRFLKNYAVAYRDHFDMQSLELDAAPGLMRNVKRLMIRLRTSPARALPLVFVLAAGGALLLANTAVPTAIILAGTAGCSVVATYYTTPSLDYTAIDRAFHQERYHVVLHCSAYTSPIKLSSWKTLDAAITPPTANSSYLHVLHPTSRYPTEARETCTALVPYRPSFRVPPGFEELRSGDKEHSSASEESNTSGPDNAAKGKEPSTTVEDFAQLQERLPIHHALALSEGTNLRPDLLYLCPMNESSPPAKTPTENLCLWLALHDLLPSVSITYYFTLLSTVMPEEDYLSQHWRTNGWNTRHLHAVCYLLGRQVTIMSTEAEPQQLGRANGKDLGFILHEKGHFRNSVDDGDQPLRFTDDAPLFTKPSGRASANENLTGTSSNGKFTPAPWSKAFEARLLKHAYRPPGSDSPSHIAAKEFKPYKLNRDRAKPLSTDFKEGCVGVHFKHSSEHIKRRTLERWDSICDTAPSRTINVITLFGFNGCGKTTPLLDFFKKNKEFMAKAKFCTTERKLRDEMAKELGFTGDDNAEAYRVGTYETSLEKSAEIWVVDEIGKFPPGYIDYGCYVCPTIKYVIICGDPCQLPCHNRNALSKTTALKSEALYWSPYADYYCLWTHRSPQAVARFWNVHSTNKEEGLLEVQQAKPSNANFMYMSEFDVDKHNLANASNLAQTIASSQGFTFKKIAAVCVDHALAKHASVHLLNMATNRSKKGCVFFGALDKRTSQLVQTNKPLAAVLGGSPIDFQEAFKKELEGMTILTHPTALCPTLQGTGREGAPLIPLNLSLRPGKLTRTQKRRALRMRAAAKHQLNPQEDNSDLPSAFRTGLTDLHEEDSREEKPTEASLLDYDEAPRTHYAATPLLQLAELQQLPLDRADRDVMTKKGLTRQFPEDLPYRRHNGSLLTNVAAKHTAADETALPFSIPKRLTMRSRDFNMADYRNSRWLGRLAADAFRRGRGQPEQGPAFCPLTFASCIRENEFSKLTKKTRAFLMANAEKNDPDWRYTYVRIFPKSQQKISAASINGKAKAVQTLAQFQDQWVLTFGPVIRYISRMDDAVKPDEIFVLAGKKISDAANWARKYLPVPIYTDNDYTAFDNSQGGETLSFELERLSYYNIPQEYADLYFEQKVGLHHQFGPSAIMRFTGEPGTYKFNTDVNEAVLQLKYDLRGFPYAVSGDDSLIIGRPGIKESWHAISKEFKLVSKTNHSTQAQFCGYIYSEYGVVREPRNLGYKLAIAWEQNRFEDVKLSYAQEIKHGCSLGDNLFHVLTDDQLNWHFSSLHFLWDNGGLETRSVLTTAVLEGFIEKMVHGSILHTHRLLSQLPGHVRRAVYKLYRGLPQQTLQGRGHSLRKSSSLSSIEHLFVSSSLNDHDRKHRDAQTRLPWFHSTATPLSLSVSLLPPLSNMSDFNRSWYSAPVATNWGAPPPGRRVRSECSLCVEQGHSRIECYDQAHAHPRQPGVCPHRDEEVAQPVSTLFPRSRAPSLAGSSISQRFPGVPPPRPQPVSPVPTIQEIQARYPGANPALIQQLQQQIARQYQEQADSAISAQLQALGVQPPNVVNTLQDPYHAAQTVTTAQQHPPPITPSRLVEGVVIQSATVMAQTTAANAHRRLHNARLTLADLTTALQRRGELQGAALLSHIDVEFNTQRIGNAITTVAVAVHFTNAAPDCATINELRTSTSNCVVRRVTDLTPHRLEITPARDLSDNQPVWLTIMTEVLNGSANAAEATNLGTVTLLVGALL